MQHAVHKLCAGGWVGEGELSKRETFTFQINMYVFLHPIILDHMRCRIKLIQFEKLNETNIQAKKEKERGSRRESENVVYM